MDHLSSFGRTVAEKLTLILVLLLPGFLTTHAQTVKESNAHIGLVYPISTNGTQAKEYVNGFSLHVIAGVSRGEKKLAISGLSNIILDSATGVQIAGFSNHIGNTANGVQLAGFMNLVAHDANGSQIAGFMNVSGNGGVQVAGFFNKAGNVQTQVAGFINVAKKVRGLQLAGFINIADSSDYPVAILNFIKNGEKTIGISTDETLTLMATFRSGGKKLYGIAGAGYNNKGARKLFAWEAGIGYHLPIAEDFRVNMEAVTVGLTDFQHGDWLKSSIRILPALHLTSLLEVFAGPSFNYVHSYKGQGADIITHYLWSETKSNGNIHGLYFGFTGGITIRI